MAQLRSIGTVHLGFEVGSGKPVTIPLRHLAVTGQTQEAGKTTTLEALIAAVRAPGGHLHHEAGRGLLRRRAPDPALLSGADGLAVRGVHPRGQPRGEAEVRAGLDHPGFEGGPDPGRCPGNVRRALADPKTRGMSADVYLVLDAYLDVVVPQIAAVKWSPTLVLAPGVNAMDLSGLALEMQHLVIRSTIQWVLDHEKGTVVVVPEAWKFIPQGRGTPVKLAAESYIRQGAALQNYLWLDSQDLGGIEKGILRSVPVWLLGVQREANEIKRTLDNIPASTAKPKPADIARLKVGEFYACWGEHAVKTYVQPSWSSAMCAQATAMGDGEPAEAPRVNDIPTSAPQEEPEMCELHQKLERELADVKAQLRRQGCRPGGGRRTHEADRGRPCPGRGEREAPPADPRVGRPALADAQLRRGGRRRGGDRR